MKAHEQFGMSDAEAAVIREVMPPMTTIEMLRSRSLALIGDALLGIKQAYDAGRLSEPTFSLMATALVDLMDDGRVQ